MNRTCTIAIAAAASAAVFSMLPIAAHAQVHTVTGVGIVAKPRSYVGSCPTTIEFIATIHVSHHPARVEYQWERSDGGRGPRETVEIRSAGRSVTDTWTLGRPGMRRNVWVRLHVLAPTGISSPEAHAHIDCR
ncbi:MAG TPA: hypothetical protein VEG27_03430 [Usitatibacter sp.]|nr:hypothetical protein [Usitatibacter sp.]